MGISLSGIGDGLSNLWDDAQKLGSSAMASVQNFASGAVETFEDIGETVTEAYNVAADFVDGDVDVAAFFKGLVESASKWLEDSKAYVSDVLDSAWDTVSGAFDDFGNWWDKAYADTGAFISSIGSDVTLDPNGVEITYDKKTTNDGNTFYWNDGEIVKIVDEETGDVDIIQNNQRVTYHSDGSYEVEYPEDGSTEFKTYYSKDGIKVKEDDYTQGLKVTTYFSEDGRKIKTEERSAGDFYVHEYHEDGTETGYKNGILSFKTNSDGTIYYDEDGNVTMERLSDKTISYEKDGTIEIEYNDGHSEEFKDDKIISSTKDGIKTSYRYLQNGEKVSYIEKNADGNAVLTEFDAEGNMISQTIGKHTGGITGSDGVTTIPIVKGTMTKYDSEGNVLSVTDENGITTGQNFVEYRDYNVMQERVASFGMDPSRLSAIATHRENYDDAGNILNITSTSKGSGTFAGIEVDIKKVEILYPDGTTESTETRFNSNGEVVQESYYKRNASGNILKYNYKDANGVNTTAIYDGNGNIIESYNYTT